MFVLKDGQVGASGHEHAQRARAQHLAVPSLDVAGRGLLHLLGSDAHSSRGGRPVRLSGGLARLAEVERLKPHLDWIGEQGPRAIISGEPAAPPFAPA